MARTKTWTKEQIEERRKREMSRSIDLTQDDVSVVKKRALDAPLHPSSIMAKLIAAEERRKKVKKSETPHVLLWICTHGKLHGRQWKAKSLRVIGVYASKEAAEQKKRDLMNRYECGGHGDIIVGSTVEDEIDLLVKPCEEADL